LVIALLTKNQNTGKKEQAFIVNARTNEDFFASAQSEY